MKKSEKKLAGTIFGDHFRPMCMPETEVGCAMHQFAITESQNRTSKSTRGKQRNYEEPVTCFTRQSYICRRTLCDASAGLCYNPSQQECRKPSSVEETRFAEAAAASRDACLPAGTQAVTQSCRRDERTRPNDVTAATHAQQNQPTVTQLFTSFRALITLIIVLSSVLYRAYMRNDDAFNILCLMFVCHSVIIVDQAYVDTDSVSLFI